MHKMNDVEFRAKFIEEARLVATKLGGEDPKLRAIKYVVNGTIQASDKALVFRDEIVEVKSSTTTKSLEVRRCDRNTPVLMLLPNGSLQTWDESSKFYFGHLQALANNWRHSQNNPPSPTPPRR